MARSTRSADSNTSADPYAHLHDTLRALFGVEDVVTAPDHIVVGDTRYPVLDDVVLLSPPDQYSDHIIERLGRGGHQVKDGFAPDIQSTFGREWQAYADMLPEHDEEFARYFDLVDLDTLGQKRVMDLGCGMGRWSYLMAPHAEELVLVDFSDAIFVARETLRGRHERVLFFHGDITKLPFVDDAADLAYCLGVLHHLPLDCLDVTRQLARLAPELLVFLYYALDNRPAHYRLLLKGVTAARLALCRIEDEDTRLRIAKVGAKGLYRPLVRLGEALERSVGQGSQVPLYDFYKDKSLQRIEQDVYDRFFTRIEQRVSRADIRTLRDTFDDVVISDDLPYWHFLCRGRRR